MSVYLLDVNVLLALVWPAHEAHARTATWFRSNQKAGWATCPFTQTALVRILSNPSFSPHALSPREAAETLATALKQPAHRFWADDIDYLTATSSFGESISGHRQVSDAYLLGLTIHRRGKFATLDYRVLAMLPEESRLREVVVEV